MAESTIKNIEVILQDPRFVELSLKVMEMEQDYNEEYLVPFEPDDEDENGNPLVKKRKGDYGKELSYIGVKHIRERLDDAFNKKWSFFVLAEHRETEPFERYDKSEDDYVSGSNYLKCVGMLVVPGFGIRMDYGVKKVRGDSESADWKACKTDALKRCAEAFGIYLNYKDEDDDDEDSGSGRGSRSNSKGKEVNLDEIEFTDDELEEALETEITFGKNKGLTLQEIYEDDPSYIKWLSEKAEDEDIRFFAAIIMKHQEEQEEEKNSRRNKNNRGGGRSGSSAGKGKETGSRRGSRASDADTGKSGRSSNKGKSSSRSKSNDSELDEDEIEGLIEACRAELDTLDKVRAKSVMASVSISNKFPKGKTKLEQFTVAELNDLMEVFGE